MHAKVPTGPLKYLQEIKMNRTLDENWRTIKVYAKLPPNTVIVENVPRKLEER